LRTEILGGQDADGLPITGVVSDLRQQVEGINANLGNKLKRMESSQPTRVREIVTHEMDARRGMVARLLAWVTGR
jgi:hypothetical protein